MGRLAEEDFSCSVCQINLLAGQGEQLMGKEDSQPDQDAVGKVDGSDFPEFSIYYQTVEPPVRELNVYTDGAYCS